MIDKELYDLLKNMLKEISQEEYPEICEYIDYNIDNPDMIVIIDRFSVANDFCDLDNCKKLPNCVADFVMKVYKEELEKGRSEAALNLGALFYTGRIGEQNYKKAMYYFNIAAKQGNGIAQENLGYCYYYGRDTEIDYEKAFHYYALGAFTDRLRSLYKIGDMYRNGYFVEKNEKEAFKIYEKCLYKLKDYHDYSVDGDIMMRMADCYYEGIGVEPDYQSALEFYQKAELAFYERLLDGDFYIKGNYEKVIARQDEIRKKLYDNIPTYDWT